MNERAEKEKPFLCSNVRKATAQLPTCSQLCLYDEAVVCGCAVVNRHTAVAVCAVVIQRQIGNSSCNVDADNEHLPLLNSPS